MPVCFSESAEHYAEDYEEIEIAPFAKCISNDEIIARTWPVQSTHSKGKVMITSFCN